MPQQDEINAFVARVMRALQQQINVLQEHIIAQEERIQVLEKQNMWSLLQGRIEQPPVNAFVVHRADGRLGLDLSHLPSDVDEEEVVNDTAD